VYKKSALVPVYSYTVATLPTISGSGIYVAFASDGRKSGEGAGVGTGVLCYWDGSDWIAEGTAAAVAA